MHLHEYLEYGYSQRAHKPKIICQKRAVNSTRYWMHLGLSQFIIILGKKKQKDVMKCISIVAAVGKLLFSKWYLLQKFCGETEEWVENTGHLFSLVIQT